ncbi:MAG: radical SAM protein [Candidatus Aminicenantes bacterium]|nr:radical SAM protein [Candidatus Aminicenantes bacterium]
MKKERRPEPVDVDLVLVFPPFERLLVSMENIGIGSIAASARAAGFRCAIINAGLYGLSTGQVIEILRRSRFRVLGLSTIHWTMPAAIEIARAVRSSHPHCHIILGGLEAALDADRLLRTQPCVDSIGLGEGERTVATLLRALSESADWRGIPGLAYRDGAVVRRSRPAGLIAPLDDLPLPARDDIAAVLAAGGPVSIGTSRGCPGRCSFCSVRAFYGVSEGPAWRGRSPRSIVAEMREITDRYGAHLFSFVDETAMGPGPRGPARLAELAGLIRTSGLTPEFFMAVRADQVEEPLFRELRSAGLRKVEVGLESMAPTQLKRFGKGTRVADNRRALQILEKLGLAVEILMIPFDPGVTAGELRTNLRFYRKRFQTGRSYDVAPLSMGNYLCPYPGTGTRAVYERNGWLAGDGQVSFRALDARLQKVGHALMRFIGSAEFVFPRSYMNLGNLWVNSAGLPASVSDRIGGMCSETGNLFLDFAEWALKITAGPQPIPIQEIGRLIDDLRRFLARLQPLREELGALVEAHANDRRPMPRGTSDLAKRLFLLARRRKRRILIEASRAPDPYRIITGILDALTRDAPS